MKGRIGYITQFREVLWIIALKVQRVEFACPDIENVSYTIRTNVSLNILVLNNMQNY